MVKIPSRPYGKNMAMTKMTALLISLLYGAVRSTSPLAGTTTARWALSGSTVTSGLQSPMARTTPGPRASMSMASPTRPAMTAATTATPSVAWRVRSPVQYPGLAVEAGGHSPK